MQGRDYENRRSIIMVSCKGRHRNPWLLTILSRSKLMFEIITAYRKHGKFLKNKQEEKFAHHVPQLFVCLGLNGDTWSVLARSYCLPPSLDHTHVNGQPFSSSICMYWKVGSQFSTIKLISKHVTFIYLSDDLNSSLV